MLILSALDDVDDKVSGLRSGGDDYLGKPYAFSELLARLEGLHRRRASEPPLTRLKVADLEIDLLARTVHRAGKTILLQPREFKLLEYLMRNAGRVVTRTMLLENVWDYHFDPQTNVIDVHFPASGRRSTRTSANLSCRPFGGQAIPSVRTELKLLRTSTFRLAAVYLVLFAVSVSAILAYVYWNTAVLIEQQTDDTIAAEVRGIAEQYQQRGIAGVIDTVARRSQDGGGAPTSSPTHWAGAWPATSPACRWKQ